MYKSIKSRMVIFQWIYCIYNAFLPQEQANYWETMLGLIWRVFHLTKRIQSASLSDWLFCQPPLGVPFERASYYCAELENSIRCPKEAYQQVNWQLVEAFAVYTK